MKHFAYLVLAAILSLMSSDSAAAQPAPSRSTNFTSAYTDLVTGCESSGGKEGGHVSTFCKGPGIFRVHYFDSATALQVSIESRDGAISIPLATQSLDYARKGRKVEWRSANEKPFAVILRVFKYGEVGGYPYQGEPTAESLVIKGLPGNEEIDLEVDARRPKANEEARRLADTSQMIKADPQNAEAYYLRGSTFALIGKTAEAINDFDRAIELKPDRADAHFHKARILFITGDLGGALAAYDIAIKLQPKSAEMHFFRAGVYVKKSEYDPAIADYTKAITLGGFDPARSHYYRGAAYSAKKSYDLAVADYTRSVSLIPKNAAGDKWSDEWLVSANYEGRASAYCAQSKKELAAREEDLFIKLTGTPLVRCGDSEVISGELLDRLCAGIDNSYQCAQAIEQSQLKRISNSMRVKREGKRLLLRREGGEWLAIEDFEKSGEEDSVIKYSFRQYLAEIGYYLIHRQFYEGDSYLLIDDRSGRKYELQALPVVSGDRQRIVTASNGIGGGYNPNAVQIWRFTEQGMVIEQTIEPKDWGPSDPLWETNDTIRLTRNPPVIGDPSQKKGTVTLKFETTWQLRDRPE